MEGLGVLLRGSPDEKGELLFRVFDTASDGRISRGEFDAVAGSFAFARARVLEAEAAVASSAAAAAQPSRDSAAFEALADAEMRQLAEELFGARDGSEAAQRSVGRREFIEIAARQPLLSDVLGACMARLAQLPVAEESERGVVPAPASNGGSRRASVRGVLGGGGGGKANGGGNGSGDGGGGDHVNRDGAVAWAGWLMKLGRVLQRPVTRWFVVEDTFLYEFVRPDAAAAPSRVTFLRGLLVEPVDARDKHPRLEFGLRLAPVEDPLGGRALFAGSAEEQAGLLRLLRVHAGATSVEAFYELGAQIGQGRFSVVRQARERATGRSVAVKVVDKYRLDEGEREALRMEIAVQRLLRHANLVGLLAMFETKESIFLVMPLFAGGDLVDAMNRRVRKRLSESEARLVVRQLLQALAYLHRRGIIHRDVKPENVLLHDSRDLGQVALGDFGFSTFAFKEVLTTPCGTLAYIAPEVLRGTGYNRAVDLWSLGVTMHMLLVGRVPLFSDDREQLIQLILGKPPDLAAADLCAAATPPALALLAQLLERDPERRVSAEQALSHAWFANP